MNVQAEFSLYPLRTGDVGDAIQAFVEVLNHAGLDVRTSTMSSSISGDVEHVFRALTDAFASVGDRYQIVLDIKVSNACPSSAPEGSRSGTEQQERAC